MAVPKKRTSISKKHIRKNVWKGKGYSAALKAFSLAKSISTGNSTSYWEFKNFFLCDKKIIKKKKGWTNLNRYDSNFKSF